MKINTLLTAMVAAFLAASATANSVNYIQDTGTPYQTPALSTFTTYGNMMAGMDVWVNYSDGSTKHTVWAATGANSGAATVGGFFSISVTGDTFNNFAWSLRNLNGTLAITSFTLAGAGGDTVFDRTYGGAIGTADSALGKDFYITGNYAVTTTYSDILNLTGASAVGDEFEQVEVAFSPNSYFGPNANAVFTQDADNAATHGTITTVPDAGSTAAMLGLGLMALAALKYRIA